MVSHDLGSPLQTVELAATMLAQVTTDHRAKRHLELIHHSCARMASLIEDLLDTANIRTGRLRLELAREPAESVIREAVELQLPFADERDIQLVRRFGVQNVDIMCDRDRLLQVFGNLIGNALKFCRPGDVVTASCDRAGDDVVFSVGDTGPGIPPERIPFLFDAYWSGTEHVKRGSGLGLYIARGIVEGHGGRIWVESRPGAGATFSFTVPIAAAVSSERQAP